MFDEIKDRIIQIFLNRITLLRLLFVVLGCILLYRCFTLQIVHGQEYLDNFMLEQEKTRTVLATRGNIYDRNGNLLAYNELAYSVKIEDPFEAVKGKNKLLNDLLYQVMDMIERNGDSVDLDFKIYVDEDNRFAFSVEGTTLLRFLADVYDHTQISDLKDEERTATAQEVMEYLSRATGKGYHFAIGAYEDPDNTKSTFLPGEGYTKTEWLKLVNIRFNMSQTAYRKYLGTVIASNVSEKTVALLLENASDLPGISISEGTVRKYVDSVYFSHILGYTGKISSDEIALLNQMSADAGGSDSAYSMSDIVGKSGIENYMELNLQGTSGYEKVMVNSTGKVISVLEHVDAKPGNDVYLSIDKDFTIAAYSIVEQKLAGLVSSKIIDAKESPSAVSAHIQIPIYDVYYSVINNSVVDIRHFTASDAGKTEREVYRIYREYKQKVYDSLRYELYQTRTPYCDLDKEYQVYQTNLISLLTKNGVLKSEKIDTNDATYIAWAVDEKISMADYLEYCISQNWVDVQKLTFAEKYPDSSQIFDQLLVKMFDLADHTNEFQKKFYKYMLLNDILTGKQICLLLYEQEAIDMPISDIERLQKGELSAYGFMLNRIRNLQLTPAQLALDPCNASVVITDVNSGQVLAMVSYPGYDNNKMANSVDAAYYDLLINDKSSPLLNYATQYKAAPGSTFKIVSAMAALDEHVIDLDSLVDCEGTFTAITPSPKCWNIYGHGDENVTTAIRDSCNYFFYQMGYLLGSKDTGTYDSDLGLETLHYYADLFGLTEKSGVEISEYAPDISDTDAVRSAIGQGTNSFTTAELARYTAAIANSGTVYNLTLLDHVTNSAGDVIQTFEPSIRNQIEMPQKYWNAIHSGMRAVVEKKSYFSDLAVQVAGKTGTAEQTKSRPNHALFICYAPYDDPEIAMATRIPFGYSSDYAAQVARDIIKYYKGLAEADELVTGTADTPDAGVTNEM